MPLQGVRESRGISEVENSAVPPKWSLWRGRRKDSWACRDVPQQSAKIERFPRTDFSYGARERSRCIKQTGLQAIKNISCYAAMVYENKNHAKSPFLRASNAPVFALTPIPRHSCGGASFGKRAFLRNCILNWRYSIVAGMVKTFSVRCTTSGYILINAPVPTGILKVASLLNFLTSFLSRVALRLISMG